MAGALCSQFFALDLAGHAATLFWDPDTNAANNVLTSQSGLGGVGAWNTSAASSLSAANDIVLCAGDAKLVAPGLGGVQSEELITTGTTSMCGKPRC
jgi:hypothetical protein